MTWLAFFLAGIVLGSFYNVVALRLPRGGSIVYPPSHCPACGRELAARDLVPVFSYLWLKGRCRFCGAAISPLYPVGELTTGLLFIWVYLVIGWRPELAVGLFLVSVLVVAALGDVLYRLIPNKLVLAVLAGGILARSLVPLPGGFWFALSGILPGTVLLGVAALASRGGMGGGDIKLAAALGLFLGWPGALLAVFFASVLGGVVGVGLILARVIGRRDSVPYAPFLAGGFLLAYLYGAGIIGWYGSVALGRW
ncbi:MAG: prepilin peptidase [Peptococcaceae bacterium]|jgi:prepilin signal peptidase PulO-like enzyme (type II secretory pathway)|nr:prepilin peptidase [Peptococcaceae bacterium]